MECCPSVITPTMGMSNCRQMLAASSSSGTRSFSVAPKRLRATSTSPEPQSRSTHSTSCPTSGRPPIECENHLLLFPEPLPQPLRICQVQREQFFISVELIGHGSLGYHQSSSEQVLVDLRDTALLLVPQGAHQRDHIQPEFSMWQSPSSFFLRTRRLMEARTGCIAAPIHFEGQPSDSLQGCHRPMAVMAHAHATSTRSTRDLKRF